VEEEKEIRERWQRKAKKEADDHFTKIQRNTRQRLAHKIANYRDSTYYSNYHFSHKFIKVAEWGNVTPLEATSQQKLVEENIFQVLKYLCVLLPLGGLDNVMRISLHIGNTTIQLPFYHNALPNPLFTLNSRKMFLCEQSELDVYDELKKKKKYHKKNM